MIWNAKNTGVNSSKVQRHTYFHSELRIYHFCGVLTMLLFLLLWYNYQEGSCFLYLLLIRWHITFSSNLKRRLKLDQSWWVIFFFRFLFCLTESSRNFCRISAKRYWTTFFQWLITLLIFFHTVNIVLWLKTLSFLKTHGLILILNH